jgi:hypothetical protein
MLARGPDETLDLGLEQVAARSPLLVRKRDDCSVFDGWDGAVHGCDLPVIRSPNIGDCS